MHHGSKEWKIPVSDDAAVGAREGREYVAVWKRSIASPHLPEVGMRLQYGGSVLEVDFRNIHEEGKRIHQPPLEKHVPSLLFRKVFIKKK